MYGDEANKLHLSLVEDAVARTRLLLWLAASIGGSSRP